MRLLLHDQTEWASPCSKILSGALMYVKALGVEWLHIANLFGQLRRSQSPLKNRPEFRGDIQASYGV